MVMKMSNSSCVPVHCRRSNFPMPCAVIRILVIMVILSSIFAENSDGQSYFVEWCIADEQTTDGELQKALDWACGNGGDCKKIQEHQPCFLPNTLKDHASYAFNSYYQRMKHKGASCYFNAAAIVTALDPSHGSCKFEYLP